MSQPKFIEYLSPMQAAFIKAVVLTHNPSKTAARVARVAERVRLHREPAVSTKLSFHTARKLIQAGIIE